MAQNTQKETPDKSRSTFASNLGVAMLEDIITFQDQDIAMPMLLKLKPASLNLLR